MWLLSRNGWDWCFGRLLVVDAGASERVHQTVVPLVTAVLEQLAVRLHHGDFRGPRPRPGRGILDGELVEDSVGTHSREALGDTQRRGRTLDDHLVVEVARL